MDNLTETANHAAIIGGWIKLDSGLDAVGGSVSKSGWTRATRWLGVHIDGSECTVGQGTADGTGKGETRIERNALGFLFGDGGLRQGNGRGGHCDGDEGVN